MMPVQSTLKRKRTPSKKKEALYLMRKRKKNPCACFHLASARYFHPARAGTFFQPRQYPQSQASGKARSFHPAKTGQFPLTKVRHPAKPGYFLPAIARYLLPAVARYFLLAKAR